ncbi:MAG: glycoside hydrolase family 65 protein [Chitinivibrionales bacterium]|nr:glycoside hydrolase family 65 protein [Chitinivibrionales bacterium]
MNSRLREERNGFEEPAPMKTTPWTITEEHFDTQSALAWEGLFTQGSGYLHIRGSIEEHFAGVAQNETYLRMPGNVTVEKFGDTLAKWGTFVPGVYGSHPFFCNELVNLPWFLDLRLTVDGERLDLRTSRVTACRRTLDLKTGELRRTVSWQTATGKEIEVELRRFVSMARPRLCCQEMRIRATRTADIDIAAGVDADVRTSGYDHLTDVSMRAAGDRAIECLVKTDTGDTVTTVSELSGPVERWRFRGHDRQAERLATIKTAPAEECIVEKRTAVATSRDRNPADPGRVLAEAAGLTYEQLLQENAEAWAARWDACDVVIDGDEEAQIALRVALYHLLRCHVPGDDRVAIDAKGYAGDAYFGHFFWDTEMYMLPFYLYTDPERARTLVDFRIQTLEGARRNAAEYGYPGARYAWESDSQGNECTAKGNWQYRDHEIHVTGDVAYGMVHYARATGDHEYLHGPAARVLVECARYWVARMDWREGDGGRPALLGVMGPDEYTPISNNNAYTNRIAAFTLAEAARVGARGGADADERARFAEIAGLLPLPSRGDLVLQCEEFEALADPRFDELWTDRGAHFAAQVSQERLYRSKCSKQGDVLMLMWLFPGEFTRGQMQTAWDYYEPLCTHDSSLSAGVHALMACRLGMADRAWEFWRKTAAIDLDVSHGGAAQGIHIANCAAAWMVAVMGFGGLADAMESEELTFNPALPESWRRLVFPLVWKGRRVRVEVTHAGVTVTDR